MKCTSCGTELEAGAKFCTNCGKTVEAGANQAAAQPTPVQVTPAQNNVVQPKKSNKTLWIVLGVVGGIILLFIIGVILLFALVFKSVEKEINNLPNTSDYTEKEDNVVYSKKDPTGHTIKVVEDKTYIYKVDTDYLYDKSQELIKDAKLAKASDIDNSNATTTQKDATKAAIKKLDNTYMAVTQSDVTEELKKLGYDEATIKYALANCGADWEERATIKAYQYLSAGGMSKKSVTNMLTTKFSAEIANKVMSNNKFDFYEQAAYDACFGRFTSKNYGGSYDREKEKQVMEFEGYTKEEIDFALNFVYDEMKDES